MNSKILNLLLTLACTAISCKPNSDSYNKSTSYKVDEQIVELSPEQIRADSLREHLSRLYYFGEYDLNRFNTHIDSTLSESKKNNSKAIIVDKSAYTLFVIDSGRKVAKFNVELGFNPFHQKAQEGDGTTPEGMYVISKKLPFGVTRFHKSMHINYPNEEDKARFTQLRESGFLPEDATIGGLIAIHGKGSGRKGNAGGRNWTLGCVALSNSDMDIIYDLFELGDRVTIVRYTSRNLNAL